MVAGKAWAAWVEGIVGGIVAWGVDVCVGASTYTVGIRICVCGIDRISGLGIVGCVGGIEVCPTDINT